MNPNARTVQYIRKLGGVADVVERFSSFVNRRFDYLGIADVIAVTGDTVIAIQATTKPNMKARFDKIKDTIEVLKWMQAGKFLIMGWYKLKNRWKPEIWELGINEGKVIYLRHMNTTPEHETHS